MIVADSTIPPSTYPQQDYQVLGARRRGGVCSPGCWPDTSGGCTCDYVSSMSLRGLGVSNTTAAVGFFVATGAAILAIRHFFPRRSRSRR